MFIPAQAVAVTIRTLEITHDKGSYQVTFDVLLAAEPEKAWALLSDYQQWSRLSHNLKEAQLLEHFPDGRQRIRVRFRSCVLIFCKTIRQVKDVTTRPKGDILTVMVPEQGDFTSGWEHWRILAEQDKTRVHYNAEIVPGFRLPPLIGPSILKHKLRRTLIGMAKKLETLAAP
ncbi:MAG: SRPBCC family protein [Gammaproteobacteria bacterium]|nr:SRPBCC family protein [Gammaproteobacteria bacterium]